MEESLEMKEENNEPSNIEMRNSARPETKNKLLVSFLISK